jgi:hypothetical protein
MSCTLAAIWSTVTFWVFEFDFDDLAHFILFHPLLSGCFQVCVCVRVCVNVYNQACPSWVWYLENGGLNPEHGNVERWTFQRLGLSSKNLGEYADVLYITFYIHRSGMLMDTEDLATKHGGTKPIIQWRYTGTWKHESNSDSLGVSWCTSHGDFTTTSRDLMGHQRDKMMIFLRHVTNYINYIQCGCGTCKWRIPPIKLSFTMVENDDKPIGLGAPRQPSAKWPRLEAKKAASKMDRDRTI